MNTSGAHTVPSSPGSNVPRVLNKIVKTLQQRLADSSFSQATVKNSLEELLLMSFYSQTKPIVIVSQEQAGKDLISALVLEDLMERASDLTSQSLKNRGQTAC